MTQPPEEQKSRVIFEFLKLGDCWHEWADIGHSIQGRTLCRCKCGVHGDDRTTDLNPNYFARDLADHLRVEMVTAALDEFGGGVIAYKAGFRYERELVSLPASVIAEAIYTLIQEKNDGNN